MISMQHGRAQVAGRGARRHQATARSPASSCASSPTAAPIRPTRRCMPLLTGLMASGVYTIPKVDFALRGRRDEHDADRRLPRRRPARRRPRCSSARWTCSPPSSDMDPADSGAGTSSQPDEFPHDDRRPARPTTRATTSGRWTRCWRTPATTQLRAEQAAAPRPRRRRQLGIGLCSYVEFTGVRLGVRHLRGRRGRHGHRHRRHVAARPGPRHGVRAARLRRARHPDGRRHGRPVRHRAGPARHGHDGLALAAGRRQRGPDATDEVLDEGAGGSPRTCSRPTPTTSRSCRAGPRRRRLARRGDPWAELAAAADVAPPEGFDRGLAARERLRDAGRDLPVRRPRRRRRGRHRDRARAAAAPRHRRRLPAASSTRCWSRARCTAASPRASRRRCSRRSRYDEDGNPLTGYARRLRDPVGGRPAELRDRAHARRRRRQPARRQGHRRVGHDRLDAGGARTPSSTPCRHLGVRHIDMPAHAAAGLAGDRGREDVQRSRRLALHCTGSPGCCRTTPGARSDFRRSAAFCDVWTSRTCSKASG